MESVQKFNPSCKKGTRIPKPSVHPLLGSSSTLVRGFEKEKYLAKQINNGNKNNNYVSYVDKGRSRWEPGHDHESEERNKYLYVAEKNMTGAKIFYGSKVPAINSDAVDSAIRQQDETASRRHSAPHETVRDTVTDITLSPRFCSRSINSRWDDVTPFKDALDSNTTSNQYTMHGMSSPWSDRSELKKSEGVGSTDRLIVLDAMNDDTSHTSKIQEWHADMYPA